MIVDSAESAADDIVRTVFPTMGNTARVTIVGGDDRLVEHASRRLHQLEERWSRFVPTSDISRLNMAGGAPLEVSEDTVRLVRHMVGGWTFTNGLFDPSMLGELVHSGYGRSLVSNALTVLPSGVEWAKDLASLEIDDHRITLPVGMVLDPGGIGKGLAADLVAGELIELGASGALVSVGGDIRCIGTGDRSGRWIIDIESPFDRAPLCAIEIADGAVATSSLNAKTFPGPDGNQHTHILDPRSRTTVDTMQRDVVQATVIAGECVWAEIFTKAYLVLDAWTRIEFASEHGLDAMLVRSDGSTITSQGWKKYQ